MEKSTIAMLISFYCVGITMPFSRAFYVLRTASGLGTEGFGQAMSLAMFVERNGL